MRSQRLRRAVAGDEYAEFPARRFDRDVRLARRRRKAFREDLEMVDQRLHFRFHLFPLWRHDAGRVGFDGSIGWNFVYRLTNDFQALAHFRDANQITSVAIGIRARRHVEVEFFVARIRENLAIIVGDTRGAERRTGHAHRDCVGGGDVAYAFGARDPDAVFRKQRLVFVDAARQHLDHAPDRLQPTRRRLQRQPADAEIAGHHPLAGDQLENVQNLLALAEAVQEDGHGAEVDRVRAEPYQVRLDARQLGQKYADVLRALRRL